MRRYGPIAHLVLVLLLWWTPQLCRTFPLQQQSPRSHSILLLRGTSRLTQDLQRANEATQRMQTNLTAAHEAVALWQTIDLDAAALLESHLQTLCCALYASCLVRVGQDAQALNVYERAQSSTSHEIMRGRARCLQRLLRYGEALEVYQKLGSTDEAVLCALRLGDVAFAMELCEDDEATMALLRSIVQGRRLTEDELSHVERVKYETPTFYWVHWQATKEGSRDEFLDMFAHLDLVHVNLGGLQDPNLLYLDDKVHLHRLLESENAPFWPKGWLLPEERPPTKGRFVLKQRAGYGSHGNEVLDAESLTLRTLGNEKQLLQQLIDPPLLYQGFKFSIRAYVICFDLEKTEPEVFLSSLALVKLAESDYRDSSVDRSVHMTNSGQGDAMKQFGIEVLRQEWGDAAYKDMLDQIRHAVGRTLSIYKRRRTHDEELVNSPPGARLGCGMPKILGFDFLLDHQRKKKVWLLEVNRFPGLEARDESDRVVKEAVVQDAWNVAFTREEQGDSARSTASSVPTRRLSKIELDL